MCSAAVLFTVIHKSGNQYILPVAQLSKSPPVTLRLVTKRGWGLFDINFLSSGSLVTPVSDGQALAPVRMTRGMWEVPSTPNDSLRCEGAVIPIGLVSLPSATELVVANYKLPTGMKMLSAGELEEATRQVPLLVMPTVQISAAQLGDYTRSVHQIPRVGANPAILLEYHDDHPRTDTSIVGQRRPRHVLIVLEKGVYNYRPSWQYTTTGAKNDKPILRYLGIMDADMDGRSELFLYVEPAPGFRYIMAFQEWNDTWREYWRRPPGRCDQ